MKKHNFNAGPSILPREVIEDTAKAILDFNGSGLSLMEISHRAKDFQPVVDEAEALFKELLNIPEGYSVLFLGGGASMEFCMVPYNFLEKKAAYLNTGVWAKKAMKEVLKDIQDGTFAKNWLLENQINRPYFNAQKRIHREHQIETVGADLRKMMCWLKK